MTTAPSRATLTAARRMYLAGEIPEIDEIPCVCGAIRTAHAGPTHAGGFDRRECTRYREDRLAGMVARAHHAADHGFDESMAAYDRMSRKSSRKKKAGEVSVRPSDLYGCRKAIEYRERPPEGYVPAETDQRAAWMGGLIHDELGRRRAALYPWRMYETEVRIPGSDRPYRFDEYDPITATLYEIKTAGEWRWDKVGQEGVDDKWLGQAMLYAWALRERGYDVDTVVLLVLRRDNGLSESFEFDYDEKIARRALDWIANTAMLVELDLLASEPNEGRDESGPSTSIMCSKLCPARRHCWNMDAAADLDVTPEYLTILGYQPHTDDQVVEHLTELVALSEARLAAKAREDALKAIVKNIDPRPYGEFQPQAGGSSSKDWKGWEALVKAEIAKPDGQRMTVLPDVAERKTRYWSWKRIRVAEKIKRTKAETKALKEAAEALAAPAPEAPTLADPWAEAS